MALTVLVTTAILLSLGYRLYARRIDRQMIQTDPRRTTPARRRSDGVDFFPTHPGVLFGFQFKSISLDPILGPVIAMQFGWLPAILWLLLGTLFAGWVQDYTITILTIRQGGASLGELWQTLISPKARAWFLPFVYFYLLLSLSALSAIIAPVLARESVPPGMVSLMIGGLLAGQMLYRWRTNALLASVTAVLILLGGVYVGILPAAQEIVAAVNGLAGESGKVLLRNPLGYGDLTWVGILWVLFSLGFCYLGATLPLWRFSLPVNATAAWFILLGMGGAAAGIIFATLSGEVSLSFELPAFVTAYQPQLGPLWPLLFVVISSGAGSGWSGLVSSASTARQVLKETDTLPLTAGSAFTGTLLSVLGVIFAAAIGVSAHRYDPAQNYQLVAGAAGVFAAGMSLFLDAVGFPLALGNSVAALFLVVTALTAMQLILRYMQQVSGEFYHFRNLPSRSVHGRTLVAALFTLVMVFSGLWQWTWPVFGGANLLIAGLFLLLVSTWLSRQAKSYHWTFWPGIILSLTALAALAYLSFYDALYKGILSAGDLSGGAAIGHFVTLLSGGYIIVVALVLLGELQSAFRVKKKRYPSNKGL